MDLILPTTAPYNDEPVSTGHLTASPIGLNTHGFNTSENIYHVSTTKANGSISDAVYTPRGNNEPDLVVKFTLFLWQTLPPPVIILGTTGNVLAFLVMNRKRLKETRMSMCLRLLAVIDTIILWTGYVRFWIWKMFGLDVRSQHHLICKAHSFSVAFFTQFAAWIIVCIAFDRFMVVYFPYVTKRTFSKLKSAIGLLLVGLLLVLANLHFFWSLQLDSQGHCTADTTEKFLEYFVNYIWPWVDLSLYSIVPALLITVFNIAIIFKVNSSRRHRTALSRTKRLSKSRVSFMTYTLIIISFMFLITTLPICTFMIFHMSHMETLTPIQKMWFAVVNFLCYLNSACNFIFYLVSSSFFRAELQDMLCCGKIKNNEQLQLEGHLVPSSSFNGAQYGIQADAARCPERLQVQGNSPAQNLLAKAEV